ncbi:MAG: hypothetical protein WC273_11450 [Dehalococcoidia bacterium]
MLARLEHTCYYAGARARTDAAAPIAGNGERVGTMLPALLFCAIIAIVVVMALQQRPR